MVPTRLITVTGTETDYEHFAPCPELHGYLSKQSTITNLTTLTSFIIREMEKGHQVDAIYTDLSAAFDKMNHNVALPNSVSWVSTIV